MKPDSTNAAAPPKKRPTLEQRLREFYGWVFVRALGWISAAAPDRQLARARLAARLLWLPDAGLYRRNGPLVFGEMKSTALRQARFEYWACWLLNAARMRGPGPSGILGRVKVSGVGHLEAAIAENKGVLLVSAHAGSWWDAPAVVASLGHSVSSVIAPLMQGEIVAYLQQVARELDCYLTFVRMGAYEAARAAFKKGEVFYLACDFATRGDRSIGVPVGQRAELRLDTGPGVMAIRHQVPVVWVDTFHDESGRSCIAFQPAFHAGKGTSQPSPESVLQTFMDRLNDQVARHPEQWWLLGFDYLHERSDVPSSDPSP